MSDISTKSQELAKQLWAIANDLRGNMDSSKFKNYILGTIFYRYLSERTENYMDEILKNDSLTYREALKNEELEEAVKEMSLSHLGYIIEPDNLFNSLVEKIKGGWTDVDVIICTPTVMAKIGPIGRILGPRGLMPNPKTGTVTMDVATAVKEVKAGKIDFKVDKQGIVHTAIGKVSFSAQQLAENAVELLNTIQKLKPQALKGTYVRSIFMSATMSPGICIDTKAISATAE